MLKKCSREFGFWKFSCSLLRESLIFLLLQQTNRRLQYKILWSYFSLLGGYCWNRKTLKFSILRCRSGKIQIWFPVSKYLTFNLSLHFHLYTISDFSFWFQFNFKLFLLSSWSFNCSRFRISSSFDLRSPTTSHNKKLTGCGLNTFVKRIYRPIRQINLFYKSLS